MRLLIMGPAGSGKTTQAKLLSKAYGIPHISVGELIREEAAGESDLGRKARDVIDSGQLVSDELIFSMITERLSRKDAAKGFILEGYPRNNPELQMLNQHLKRGKRPIQAVLVVDVDLEVLMQRLTGRRICRSCGTEFNIFVAPPRMDDQCDECGGSLKHRADDREATIHSRLKVYESQILPLIEQFREAEMLEIIQGIGESKHIHTAMKAAVESLKSRGLFKDQPKSSRLSHVAKAAGKVAKEKAKVAETPAEKPEPKKKPKVAPAKPAKKKAADSKPLKKKKVTKKASKKPEKKLAKKVTKKAAKKTAKKMTKKVAKKAAKKVAKKTAKKVVKKAAKKKAAKKKASKKKK